MNYNGVDKMTKLRPYAILTTDSNRIEVKAYNINDAYKKARKKLIEFIKQKNIMTSEKTDLTKAYMTFGKSGINTTGFIVTDSSIKAYEKHKMYNEEEWKKGIWNRM